MQYGKCKYVAGLDVAQFQLRGNPYYIILTADIYLRMRRTSSLTWQEFQDGELEGSRCEESLL